MQAEEISKLWNFLVSRFGADISLEGYDVQWRQGVNGWERFVVAKVLFFGEIKLGNTALVFDDTLGGFPIEVEIYASGENWWIYKIEFKMHWFSKPYIKEGEE